MSDIMNRAQRRARAREQGFQRQRLKRGLVAVGAVAALGAGTIAGPAATAMAETPVSSATDLSGMDLGAIIGMMDDPMVKQFVEMCRTGGLATGPEASKSTEYDPDNPPLAVADCSKSNGTGIALVLPESLEMGQAAEDMKLDLGDDINLLLVKYRMGERNLIEVLGGVVLGSNTIKNLADLAVGVRVDPGAFDKYSSYEAIQRDAALPVNIATKDVCVQDDGSTKNPTFGSCLFAGGTLVRKGQDINGIRRAEALKMTEFLTGHTYDHSAPQILPGVVKPIGRSVIEGDGINVALSMRGGNALARTGNELALALAGADRGRTSSASAQFGIASAVNMDTDDIKFTWFGQEVDFSKLRAAGLLDSDLAGEAGAEAGAMLDMVEGLELPGLKEVACFGLNTTATAEGLGSCTNVLGTFDYYRDLRPVTDGGHRQTQWGLTDVTSVFMGNDALLKQLGPMLGGDTSGIMDSPFMQDMLAALLSEDQRIKFAKDFIRYTQDVETVFAKEPVLVDGVPALDEDGNPVMKVKTTPRMTTVTVWVDADGNEVDEGTAGATQTTKSVQVLDGDGQPIFDPVIERTTTAHWLTSDYGLRAPLVISWLGHEIVFFPPVEVNGTTRPNLIGLPQIKKITGDAQSGLLPKISLVQWDNPFGLGTLSLHNPFDPIGTLKDFGSTVTIVDDLKGAADLIGQLSGSQQPPAADSGDEATDASSDTADAEPLPAMIVNPPASELPELTVQEPAAPAPIEVVAPNPSAEQAEPAADTPEQVPADSDEAVEEPVLDAVG